MTPVLVSTSKAAALLSKVASPRNVDPSCCIYPSWAVISAIGVASYFIASAGSGLVSSNICFIVSDGNTRILALGIASTGVI